MDILKTLKNAFKTPTKTETLHKLVVERGNGVYSWNGKLYQSDIIQSCITPFARACGKLKAKQIRHNGNEVLVNPDPYVTAVLDEPNPLLTGQMLQQKLATQLMLNNNAFALILRDNYNYASEIYPIDAYTVEALYDSARRLYLRFGLKSGAVVTYPYSDIIHLRDHFFNNDVFGESNVEVLTSIMEVANATDRSLVDAVKNGAAIKWLMKWKQTLRPEDMKKQTAEFAKTYLETTSDGTGVASVDAKADIEQVTPHDYVPGAPQQDRVLKRLYRYFGTNEAIIQSTYTEDQWSAYYESVVEPFAIQLANELTRKLFTRKDRNAGNKIVFESTSLQFASMTSKLNLLQLVDRGALTPNEWREFLNLGPIEGGDSPIRRLDTAIVDEMSSKEVKMNEKQS